MEGSKRKQHCAIGLAHGAIVKPVEKGSFESTLWLSKQEAEKNTLNTFANSVENIQIVIGVHLTLLMNVFVHYNAAFYSRCRSYCSIL